jgi:fructoselysine-6-P-deglycase FrlB-like protein
VTAAGLFEADVLAQPAVLRRLEAFLPGALRELDRLTLPARPAIRFVGLGSSRYAALTEATRLRQLGLDAAVETTGAAGTPPGPDVVAVIVSAAGRSHEALAAADAHAGRSTVLAVTEDPSSPMAAGADIVFPLCAGLEQGGIATRTYRATMAVLRAVGDRFAGSRAPLELDRASEGVARVCETRREWLPEAMDALAGGDSFSVVAPGDGIGNAHQGALMLREAPRVPAGGYETGEWSHTGVYLTVSPGHRVILLRGSAFEPELLEWCRARRTPVFGIGSGRGAGVTAQLHVPETGLARGLVESTAVDLIAARLWAERGGERPADANGSLIPRAARP